MSRDPKLSVRGGGALANARGAAGFDITSRITTALWVYDFERFRIVWANGAALALWDADTIESLTVRDLRAEMSNSVQARLEQHREDFTLSPDRVIEEVWTLYPGNQPSRVDAQLRRLDFDDGGFGMLVEARPQRSQEPDTVRSADALLHVKSIIALFDRRGRALYGNPAFRATFGPGDHMFGAFFSLPADFLELLEELKVVGQSRITTSLHTTKGTRAFDIFAVRCKDAVTGDGAFVVTMLDVSQAHAHQQELAAARDEAERAGRARTEFLSIASHELRTPLNGVLGMASLLHNTVLKPDQRQMLDIIIQSGEQMLGLVENILQLVELESAEIELVPDEFSPALIVEAAVSPYRDTIEQKGLELFFSSSLCPGATYVHDATRIKQVLVQLIDNAVKFTTNGLISIRVSEAEAGALVFEVGDTGVGIPEHAIGEVFQRFYQVGGSTTRKFGGMGIGLSICRSLVDRWGGEIDVRSQVDRGSVFHFTVPAPARKQPDQTGVVSGIPSRVSHLRIVSTKDDIR